MIKALRGDIDFIDGYIAKYPNTIANFLKNMFDVTNPEQKAVEFVAYLKNLAATNATKE